MTSTLKRLFKLRGKSWALQANRVEHFIGHTHLTGIRSSTCYPVRPLMAETAASSNPPKNEESSSYQLEGISYYAD